MVHHSGYTMDHFTTVDVILILNSCFHCISQLPTIAFGVGLVAVAVAVAVAMAREETNLETSTASLLAVVVDEATSSKRFQVSSRLSCISFSFNSSSWNLDKHSSKSTLSTSVNIFLTFSVELWTAWFQWPLVFLSNAGKIIGSITERFWIIRFLMWSLFHKNKARSATCRKQKEHFPNHTLTTEKVESTKLYLSKTRYLATND